MDETPDPALAARLRALEVTVNSLLLALEDDLGEPTATVLATLQNEADAATAQGDLHAAAAIENFADALRAWTSPP